ncbi:hypothetical protein DSECCO2_649770 [anaerobic digester metagenome]
MEVYNRALSVGKTISARIQVVEVKITIVRAAPSPVKMKIIGSLITIEVEGVSSGSKTTVIHGPAIVKILNHQIGPTGLCIILLLSERQLARETKIVPERAGGIETVCPRTVRRIHHIYRHTAMILNLSHFIVRFRTDFITHLIVVIIGLTEINKQISVIGIITV